MYYVCMLYVYIQIKCLLLFLMQDYVYIYTRMMHLCVYVSMCLRMHVYIYDMHE